jgi:hypothetical protein
MRPFVKIGILACFLIAPGYAFLMHITKQPIEWGVICFILAMGVFLLIYSIILSDNIKNTEENGEAAIETISEQKPMEQQPEIPWIETTNNPYENKYREIFGALGIPIGGIIVGIISLVINLLFLNGTHMWLAVPVGIFCGAGGVITSTDSLIEAIIVAFAMVALGSGVIYYTLKDPQVGWLSVMFISALFGGAGGKLIAGIYRALDI